MKIIITENQLTLLFAIICFLTSSCSNDDNSDINEQYLGNWKIESISPEIESDPNSPSCRLINDNLFFNDTGTMFWTRSALNRNGNYDQPCFDKIISNYDYNVNNSQLKLFNKDDGSEIEWTYIIDQDLLTINRIDTITIYKKVIE